MTQEPPRPLPQSSVQAAGQAATDVIGGLKQQPALLAVVTLNIVGIIAGVWFMSSLIETSRKNMERILTACFDGDHRQDRAPGS